MNNVRLNVTTAAIQGVYSAVSDIMWVGQCHCTLVQQIFGDMERASVIQLLLLALNISYFGGLVQYLHIKSSMHFPSKYMIPLALSLKIFIII